jgi:signal transduction histidine kinase
MKNKGQNQSNLNEPNNRSYLNLSKPQGLNYFTSPTVHWLENIEPANPAALLEENATPNLGTFAALKSLVESMAEPALLLNAQGQVLVMNPASRRLFPANPDLSPAAPLDYRELIKSAGPEAECLPEAELPISEALRGISVANHELVLTSADQTELVFEMNATPIKDVGGRVAYVISIFHDVSERVYFEKAKDEFISTASHELRNPLGVARGLVQLTQMRFKQRFEKGEPANAADLQKDLKQLDGVLRNIDQMSRIILDLLDACRIETRCLHFENRPVELLTLVDEVAKRMQATTTACQIKNITDPNKFARQQCLVFGDSFRLEQVLVNLIANAINYSQPGQDIEVGVYRESGQAVVMVRDFGIGIPWSEQGRLFKKFFKSQSEEHKYRSGLGLGLYICANLIREHGGKIWAESVPGQGSTFYFSLPEDDEPPKNAF